jgi:hypothetical protein
MKTNGAVRSPDEAIALARWRNPVASGEQERRMIVKRTETFCSGPEGSNPSRQRLASQPEASLACVWQRHA